jgi:imidazole glycerol-phosphate synthase subunit HisF
MGWNSMISKRIISCLDIRNGKLAKSVKFVDTKDIGVPTAVAKKYYAEGIDELVFYDITASYEKRGIMIEVVKQVAAEIFIPFSVGGGLKSLQDCQQVLLAGAEKINLNSAAVENPLLIKEVAAKLGSQCVVLSMDVLAVPPTPQIPSGYEIVIHGGRTAKGLDAIAWAKTGTQLGAGEIVVNSIDCDGTKDGYDLRLTRLVAEAVSVPVIASGGGGHPEHLYAVLTQGKADAALVASILHYNQYSIKEIKQYLSKKGLPLRLSW